MRSTPVPHETNGQDLTTPDHVTMAPVSIAAAKICSRNSKNIHGRIFIGTDSQRLGTGTTTFWYQVPPHVHNAVPGTNPLVPWYRYSVTLLYICPKSASHEGFFHSKGTVPGDFFGLLVLGSDSGNGHVFS